MKPFQIPINRLEIFLNNLNSRPTLLKSTALNRRGCMTELSKGLSWGGDLGRKTEAPVELPSKVVHVGPGTPPAENLQQKTNVLKKSLEILPVEGNRAPWLRPAQRCRAVTGLLSAPFPWWWTVLLSLLLVSAGLTPCFPQLYTCVRAAPRLGAGKALHGPPRLLSSGNEQYLQHLAVWACPFPIMG